MAQINNEDFAHLVDTAVIQAATTRLTTAVERLKRAAAGLAAATAAKASAEDASRKAAADGGDAMAAEIVLESAARTLAVAVKVNAGAEAERVASHLDINPARGRAHRGVFKNGIAIRLAAARQADAARAMLTAAEVEFHRGSAYLARAIANGTPVLFDNPGAGDVLGTYASEVALWSQANARGGDWTGQKIELPA